MKQIELKKWIIRYYINRKKRRVGVGLAEKEKERAWAWKSEVGEPLVNRSP